MRRGCATVPFAKKRQRHGRNCRAWVAADRAFWKKTLKARSKWRGGGRNRPCLLQKIVKGTVETAGQTARPTVPFAKKRQRHGRNGGAKVATDRAFCKKTPKARSKWRGEGRNRPCLLEKNAKGTVEIVEHGAQLPVPFEKNAKGTVEIAEHGSQPTVPLAKKRQRHGRNCRAEGATDRAFSKKSPKARSKLQGRRRDRPCLLQKNAKGTVNRLRRP